MVISLSVRLGPQEQPFLHCSDGDLNHGVLWRCTGCLWPYEAARKVKPPPSPRRSPQVMENRAVIPLRKISQNSESGKVTWPPQAETAAVEERKLLSMNNLEWGPGGGKRLCLGPKYLDTSAGPTRLAPANPSWVIPQQLRSREGPGRLGWHPDGSRVPVTRWRRLDSSSSRTRRRLSAGTSSLTIG
jgi:hypothetical protein